MQSFGKTYLRYLKGAEKLSLLPPPLANKILACAGRKKSPLLWQEDAFKAGFFASGLGDRWELAWKKKNADHAASCINLFQHRRWDRSWVNKNVQMDLTTLNDILAAGKGCLLLTYHHDFQHSLFAILGLSGIRLDVLAAPEESSAIYNDIGSYINLLHNNCARHFNGGRYLFFNNPRQAIVMAKKSLAEGSLLISLNDFPYVSNEKRQESYSLLGRLMSVASGSVRLARQMNVPIVVAALFREGTSYRLEYKKLDETLSYQQTLQAYLDNLKELLHKHPQFWDGLKWFADQHKIETEAQAVND